MSVRVRKGGTETDMEKKEMPKADAIRFETETCEDLSNVTFYVKEKKKINFSAVFYPELLKRMILRMERFLSKSLDMSFEPITIKKIEFFRRRQFLFRISVI